MSLVIGNDELFRLLLRFYDCPKLSGYYRDKFMPNNSFDYNFVCSYLGVDSHECNVGKMLYQIIDEYNLSCDLDSVIKYLDLELHAYKSISPLNFQVFYHNNSSVPAQIGKPYYDTDKYPFVCKSYSNSNQCDSQHVEFRLLPEFIYKYKEFDVISYPIPKLLEYIYDNTAFEFHLYERILIYKNDAFYDGVIVNIVNQDAYDVHYIDQYHSDLSVPKQCLLPYSNEVKTSLFVPKCVICWTQIKSSKAMECKHCGNCVHISCIQLEHDDYVCSHCYHSFFHEGNIHCELCGMPEFSLIPNKGEDTWVHGFCLLSLKTEFSIKKGSYELRQYKPNQTPCCFCGYQSGCIKCKDKKCEISFHFICAAFFGQINVADQEIYCMEHTRPNAIENWKKLVHSSRNDKSKVIALRSIIKSQHGQEESDIETDEDHQSDNHNTQL